MVDNPSAVPAPPICPDCGAQVAPALLACRPCHRLVHAAELKRFAAEADQAKQMGDAGAELAAWRQALELLPPDTAQHQTVTARVAELSRAVDRQPAGAKPGSRLGKGAAGGDRKSTRLNSSHSQISYAVFCLKKKNNRCR